MGKDGRIVGKGLLGLGGRRTRPEGTRSDEGGDDGGRVREKEEKESGEGGTYAHMCENCLDGVCANISMCMHMCGQGWLVAEKTGVEGRGRK